MGCELCSNGTRSRIIVWPDDAVDLRRVASSRIAALSVRHLRFRHDGLAKSVGAPSAIVEVNP